MARDGKTEAGRIRTSVPKLGGLMQGVDLSQYISFFIAKELLKSRLQATSDEIAMWVCYGKDEGGLNAYIIRGGDNEPELFIFGTRKFLDAAEKAEKDYKIPRDDYISPLQILQFLRNDIEQFNPEKRYITRKALIGRWTMQCDGADQVEVFIRDVRLPRGVLLAEHHPIAGCVNSEGELFRNGLFNLNEVREIEELHGFTGQELDKSLGDAGIVSHKGTEPKPLNQFGNEFKFSGLFNILSGNDDWFEVIDTMTKEYYLEFNNSMPTKAQAWARLCENPPTGYGINAGKDNQSITMIGIVKPFNKRSFDRRWAKYTAKSNQI